VVKNNAIEPRMMLPSACLDHRVIDGGAAARFVLIRPAIENLNEADVQLYIE